eukprot:TRINITY_DN5611_c2_g1_i1.p1 TRINITY_DN5611_c2_g1~~TRINITY_DN5611_c2_g1_i1.p1  ORF type:complete len:870 (+),score=201.31 TRINITY_DN5611_c2_g1_i1:73-2610(+)
MPAPLVSPQRHYPTSPRQPRSPPPPLPEGAAAWLESQEHRGTQGAAGGGHGAAEPPAAASGEQQPAAEPGTPTSRSSSDAPPPVAQGNEEAEPLIDQPAEWVAAPSPAGPGVDGLWRDFLRRCGENGVTADALSSASDASILVLLGALGFDPIASALLQAEWARRVRDATPDNIHCFDSAPGSRELQPGSDGWAAAARLLSASLPSDADIEWRLLRAEALPPRTQPSTSSTPGGDQRPLLLWHRPGVRGCPRGAAAAVAAVGFPTRVGRAGEAVYFPAAPYRRGALPAGDHCLVLAEVTPGRTGVLAEPAAPDSSSWNGGDSFDTLFVPAGCGGSAGNESDEYAVRRPAQCVPRLVVTVRGAPPPTGQHAAGARHGQLLQLSEGGAQLAASPHAAEDAAQKLLQGGGLYHSVAEAARLAAAADRAVEGLSAAAAACCEHYAAQHRELLRAHDALMRSLAARTTLLGEQLRGDAAEAQARLTAAAGRLCALERRLRNAARTAAGRGDGSEAGLRRGGGSPRAPARSSSGGSGAAEGAGGAELGVTLEASSTAAELLRLTFRQGEWELPQLEANVLIAASLDGDGPGVLSAEADPSAVSPDAFTDGPPAPYAAGRPSPDAPPAVYLALRQQHEAGAPATADSAVSPGLRPDAPPTPYGTKAADAAAAAGGAPHGDIAEAFAAAAAAAQSHAAAGADEVLSGQDADALRGALCAALAWAAGRNAAPDAGGVAALRRAAQLSGLSAAAAAAAARGGGPPSPDAPGALGGRSPVHPPPKQLQAAPAAGPDGLPAALVAGTRVLLASGATGAAEGPYLGEDPLFARHWWIRLDDGRVRLCHLDDLTVEPSL